MTITLTVQEDNDLWDEAEQQTPPQYDPDVGSEMRAMPKQLGNGYDFMVDLYPDCCLKISSHKYWNDLQIRQPETDGVNAGTDRGTGQPKTALPDETQDGSTDLRSP